jgi:hypothetical protein
VKKKDLLERVGQYVWIDNGVFRDPDLGIVLGYGYRQRHGRNSPVEPDWIDTNGSQAAIALHNNADNTWTAEAVTLGRIKPHEENR